MYLSKLLFIITATLLLTACKIQINVPQGGRVESVSGTYLCSSGESCVVDVVDATFDETFTAVPDTGYTFAAWQRRRGAFCAGSDRPCRLFTTLFEGTAFMQFVEADTTYYLAPDFALSNQWRQGTDWQNPSGAISSCAVKGNVYVFGIGWKSYSSVPQGVAKYDAVNDRWMSLPDMPSRQAWATVGVVGGKCYVIGGASSFGGVASTAVYEFDPSNETWRSRAPLPERRTMAASAVVGNKIYVIGGGDKDSFLPTIRSSVVIYDPASNSWTQGADMPTPRFLLAAAAIDGKVYAMGGSANANDIHTDIVERYDPATDSWSTVASMLNRKRGQSASILRGEIYSVGGVAMGFGLSSLVESYDPQGDRWINRPDLKKPRFGHNSLTVDGHIIAFGGFSSSRDLTGPAVAETEIYTD